MKEKAKRYLLYGIIGGILTMIGRLGSGAVANGIACSNMSLGAILIFAVWRIRLAAPAADRASEA